MRALPQLSPTNIRCSKAEKLWATSQFRRVSGRSLCITSLLATKWPIYANRQTDGVALCPAIGFNSASLWYQSHSRVPAAPTPDWSDDDDEQQDDKLNNISCIKKNNAYTSLATTKLHFLDMMQYLAAGSSYENFVKAYAPQVKQVKCPFPYKWLDSVAQIEPRPSSSTRILQRFEKSGAVRGRIMRQCNNSGSTTISPTWANTWNFTTTWTWLVLLLLLKHTRLGGPTRTLILLNKVRVSSFYTPIAKNVCLYSGLI